MFKFISFSTALLFPLIFNSFILKTASANHTDDSLYICNQTKFTNSFTLVDVDYETTKNFTLKPDECWQYWNYEQIRFRDNFEEYHEYNLNEDYNYYFQFTSDGVVDLFKEED